jgi:hypothetical protein
MAMDKCEPCMHAFACLSGHIMGRLQRRMSNPALTGAMPQRMLE